MPEATPRQPTSNRPFRELLDELPYPLVGLDAQRRIVYLSRQAAQVCGHDPDEVTGGPYHVLFPEELPANPQGAAITCRCKGGVEFRARLTVYDLPWGESGSLLLQLDPMESVGTWEEGGGITPRGRELLYTEALLRAQLETSPDAIVVADWDHNVLAWNRNFLDMWGLSREILAAGRGDEALAAVRDQLADPEGFAREVERLYFHLDEAEDGVEVALTDGRVLERYSRGVRDDRGLYWGRAWYYRDITERKWAQEALAASEKRFRAIFERAPLGIAVVGPDGRPLVVNPALAQMLGRTETELCGMPFAKFTHPEDVERDMELFHQLKAGERTSYRLTKRFLTAEGRVILGRLSASLMPGLGEDDTDLFLGLVEDVTENTALEEGLRLVAEVLRSANGVMITGTDGTIVRVNDAFTRITGYAAEEAVGRPACFIDAHPTDSEFYDDMMAALAWSDTWEGEIQGRRRDGSVYPLWETVTAVRDESGRAVRYVAVFTDLTERKLLASERQRRSSAMGELGRLLAHQINQPLAAIGGYAEGTLMRLRRGDVRTEELTAALDRIGEQARRAADVVGDMRRYFRGEAPEPGPVGVNTLLHGILPILPEGSGTAYHLELDLEEELPPVLADPVQLQECLINLITNAIEAGPQAPNLPVRIRVRTSRSDGWVEVAVSDSGPGVPDGLEQQIFQPLYTTKGGGSGLGLPICQFVVEEHGGQVWMERNDPGPGSTFRVRLPVASALK
jgi:PAS domain S-box-containing protein